MEHDRIAEKLKKIKALADRGVGGERETAMRIFRYVRIHGRVQTL